MNRITLPPLWIEPIRRGNYSAVEVPVRGAVRLLDRWHCRPALSCGGHRGISWWARWFPRSRVRIGRTRLPELTRGRPWVLCAVPSAGKTIRGRQSWIALVLADNGCGPRTILPVRITLARCHDLAVRLLRVWPGTKWWLLCVWNDQRSCEPFAPIERRKR